MTLKVSTSDTLWFSTKYPNLKRNATLLRNGWYSMESDRALRKESAKSILTVREDMSAPDLISGVSTANEPRMMFFSMMESCDTNAPSAPCAGSRNPTFALGSMESMRLGVPSTLVITSKSPPRV